MIDIMSADDDMVPVLKDMQYCQNRNFDKKKMELGDHVDVTHP